MLAALLDERVAQRELLEDLIVYDSTGSRPWACVDTGFVSVTSCPGGRVPWSGGNEGVVVMLSDGAGAGR
jgi:hypothetical protein